MRVRAKMNAGTHPVHGPIIKDQEYDITEDQMADQLFELVDNENVKDSAPAESGRKRR